MKAIPELYMRKIYPREYTGCVVPLRAGLESITAPLASLRPATPSDVLSQALTALSMLWSVAKYILPFKWISWYRRRFLLQFWYKNRVLGSCVAPLDRTWDS